MDLCIEHISKRFKDMTAVDDISLRLTPGVWGLLGANGAGKTTLMRMLAGIMQPKILENGQIMVNMSKPTLDTEKIPFRREIPTAW